MVIYAIYKHDNDLRLILLTEISLKFQSTFFFWFFSNKAKLKVIDYLSSWKFHKDCKLYLQAESRMWCGIIEVIGHLFNIRSTQKHYSKISHNRICDDNWSQLRAPKHHVHRVSSCSDLTRVSEFISPNKSLF